MDGEGAYRLESILDVVVRIESSRAVIREAVGSQSCSGTGRAWVITTYWLTLV